MTISKDISPWWTRERHADRRPFLRARAAIAVALRAFFANEGFIEVETGTIQVSPGNETHLHAPKVTTRGADGFSATRYIRTSPEFACKKLLAAGENKIVEFARVCRDREQGALHLPEFTMLEWYRANETYELVMDDCVKVIGVAAHATKMGAFSFREYDCDPFAEPERLTVADAFEKFAGVDLLSTLKGATGNRHALAKASEAKVRVTPDDAWSDIFSKILTTYVEPQLGRKRLTLLYDYPAPEAALARPSAGDARLAERFEIYACGVELANGFGELTDAREQRRRFTAAMDEKEKRYGERYPLDEDLLAALEHMPPCSGVALGFDRLVMLASGATRIDQVVWTPPEYTT